MEVYNPTIELVLNTQIDVVENITREDFQKNYMLPQRPVIIKKLYGKDAEVYNWTFDYFQKELGNIDVGIFDDESDKKKEFKSYKKELKLKKE